MAEMLPWLVAPRNRKEFDELESNMAALSDELYTKLQIVAAQTNIRLRRPKSNSPWAQRLAFLRVDLAAYARSVTKPMSQAGAAAVAMGKAFRKSYIAFYDIRSVSQIRQGTGTSSGFDFE